MGLFDLTGRTALITGGTRGIGLAIAQGFREAGARVWIHGSREESTRQVAEAHGFCWCSADLSRLETLDAMTAKIADEEDCLDILVNNAGYEAHMGVDTGTEEYLDRIYNINTKAPYLLIQKLLPLLKKSAHPSVINMTSIHETVPVRENSAYCMSKASLAMYTKVAALELAAAGIRVNNLAPGAIRTDMNRELVEQMDFDQWIPMKRVGDARELIGPAVFLASDASSYMTGTTVFVDGGYRENLLRY